MEKMLTTIVQLSKNKYIEEETGYLICENATLGSTGVQEYLAKDLGLDDLPPMKRVKVYRPAEEVFKPESLASLENKAFTVYHPSQMVNSKNDSDLRKGSVYNIRRDGDTIVGDIQITDQDTINKSKYIKCLSLGYNLDLDKMEGTDDSYIARNIKYNHLALVPKGRSKVAHINDSETDDENIDEGEFMSLFKRNVKVADADEDDKKDEVKADETAKDTAEKTKAEEKDAEKDEKSEVKDDCGAKDECTAKDEDKTKEEKVEKRDKEKGAEEDTVTKEIEKRVAKGDYTEKDLEKLLEKFKKGEKDKIDEDYKERKEEEKNKKVKDGGEMTLTEIDALTDPSVKKLALEEYKAKLMADKNLIYGDDNVGFTQSQKQAQKAEAKDSELERKKYYRNTLNPHKNKDWEKEFILLSDVVDL